MCLRRTTEERSSAVRRSHHRDNYFVPPFGVTGGFIGLLMS